MVREGWCRPYGGVAIAPWVTDHDAAALGAVAAAHGGAATGATARWRHGLGARPRTLEVIAPHEQAVRRVAPDPLPPAEPDGGDDEARRAHAAARRQAGEMRRWHQRCRRIRVGRSRWLRPSDVVLVDGVPTLTPAATAIALAATHPDEVRAFLVDARQAGKLTLAEVRDRLESVGSVRGRHAVVAALEALADRTPESAFHDEVLTELERHGYRPARSPLRIQTPRGRPLLPDIPLRDWMIAIELDGDRYHRDRAARRRDRDRLSGYASSQWVPLIIDHQTWTQRRREVMADLDETILAQRRRGIGVDVPLPPHLARREMGG